MFDIACIVTRGNSPHSHDDRAVICGKIIEEGEYHIETDSVLAVVCDGVSGEKYGDAAAQMAVEYFSDLPLEIPDEKGIEEHIRTINGAIISEQRTDLSKKNMATTIAGLYLVGESYMAFNMGDSSIFRYRMNCLSKISEDHTLCEEMRSIGLEAKPYEQHVITRSLGGNINELPYIDNGIDRLFECDSFVICSDGITDVVSGEYIEKVLGEYNSSSEICRKLVDTALENGSNDNISIIMIRSF